MSGYMELGNAIVKQAVDDYLANQRKKYLLETYAYKTKKNKRILGKKKDQYDHQL